MRSISGKFIIINDVISNRETGEQIPIEEPLFLLRARDGLALAALEYYTGLCHQHACEHKHLEGLQEVCGNFRRYRAEHPERLKQPGFSHRKRTSQVRREEEVSQQYKPAQQEQPSDLSNVRWKEKLLTLEEYNHLSPQAQGYVVYWQGARKGSELRGIKANPYPKGTDAHKAWNTGQYHAMLDAQDSE